MSFFKSFLNFFSSTKKQNQKHMTVMLIGVDGGGKTTLLSSIKGEVEHNTVPTVGFDREIVKHGQYHITYFDLGGGKNIRSLWTAYFATVHAAIYVIDSSDKERLDESFQCLEKALQHKLFKGKTVLFFANKQDLKHSMTPSEIATHMKLDYLQKTYQLEFNIIGITAKTPVNAPADPNIKKGLTWLGDSISKVYDTLDARVQEETRIEDERKEKEREEKFAKIRERRERERLAKEKAEQEKKESSEQKSSEQGNTDSNEDEKKESTEEVKEESTEKTNQEEQKTEESNQPEEQKTEESNQEEQKTDESKNSAEQPKTESS